MGRQACFGLVVQNHRELLQLVSIVLRYPTTRIHVILDVVIPVSVGLTPLALRMGSQELPEDRRSSFARRTTACSRRYLRRAKDWIWRPAYILVQGCPLSSDRMAAFLLRDQAARRAACGVLNHGVNNIPPAAERLEARHGRLVRRPAKSEVLSYATSE
jgi:hypothetical protein